MAPRLLPSFSNTSVLEPRSPISSTRNFSTLARMRSAARDAWSRPSTENTPRICASWLGTSCRGTRSWGLRKNWSSDFST